MPLAIDLRRAASRVPALIRRPAFLVAAVPLVLASGLAALPLLRVPGYELATAIGILLALLGGLPALAAVQAERQRAASGQELLADTPGRCALSLFALAFAADLVLCLPALFTSLLAAALTTPCNPWAGLPFYLLLPPTAAALAAAVGTLTALAARRARGAIGLYLLAVLASAVCTLWPLYRGPQVFAFNAFAGYFPGPLYDEALRVGWPLVTARIEALAWAAIALATTALLVDPRRLALGQPRPSAGPLLALVLGLAVIAVLRANAFALGLETTTADLDRALGGSRETEHFAIHFPHERSRLEVERLARDLELRYQQDRAFLGAAVPGMVQAYFYRSAGEKKRLVGAAQTDFAKPWLLQFHLQLEGFPDPVAKHELAHVLAGAFGAGPLRISERWGILPNAGLIEGLATAADDPAGELTLDQWAHAMRQLGLAPDIRRILSPQGFWAEQQGRAYTLAGSFLRYLVQRYGTGPLHALYPHGDFVRAYGQDLGALASQWERHIDATPLDERALHLAQRRFAAPSLFTRTCAREAALLRTEADDAGSGQPARALALYRRLEAIDPDDLEVLGAEAALLRDEGDLEGARAVAQRLASDPKAGDALRAEGEMLLGDLAWQAGDRAQAASRFGAVLALGPDRATARAAAIKRLALVDPLQSDALLAYFRFPAREDALLTLKELADARPALGIPDYLIGLRLTHADLPDRALAYLPSAFKPDVLGLPEVRREARRLLIRDHAQELDCAAVLRDGTVLLSQADAGSPASAPADARYLDDWLARCRFEAAHYRVPVGGRISP